MILVDGGLPGVAALDRQGADINAAIAAGADDAMRRPFGRDELIARVDGAKRLRMLVAKLGASKRALDWSEGLKITSLEAWTQLDTVIGVDLEAMLGPIAHAEHGGKNERASVAAQIPLSLASENLELRLRVAFDQPSIAIVGAKLLGEPVSSDALRDVAREIVNVAGGALRRQAQKEGVLFTVGLPADVDPLSRGSVDCHAARSFKIRLECGAAISFHVEIFERATMVVAMTSVREGMVLARDVLGAAGALLLPAGTRMTATAITRITQLLGARYQVEVADAAESLEIPRACA